MVNNTIIGVETPDFVALSSDIDKADLIKDSNIPLSSLVDIINKPNIKNAMLYLKTVVSNTLAKIELTKLTEGKTVLVLPVESKSVIDFLKRRIFFFCINEHHFCVQVNGFNRTVEINYLKSNKEQLIIETENYEKILDLWLPIIWSGDCRMKEIEKLSNLTTVRETVKEAGTIESMYSGVSERNQFFTRITLSSKNGHNKQQGTFEAICFGELAKQVKEKFTKNDLVIIGGVPNHFDEYKKYEHRIVLQIKAFAIAKAEKAKKHYEYSIVENIVGDKSFLE